MTDLDRLAVFIDYQNAYHGARQAFGTHSDPSVIGQFDPIKLSELIVERRPAYPAARQRELVQVGFTEVCPAQPETQTVPEPRSGKRLDGATQPLTRQPV